jgi:hypothetical protein
MLQQVIELQHPLAEISLGYYLCLHGPEQLPHTSKGTGKEEGSRSDRLFFNECISTQYKGILTISSSKLQSFEIAEIHN